jgi:hypothetical protein
MDARQQALLDPILEDGGRKLAAKKIRPHGRLRVHPG